MNHHTDLTSKQLARFWMKVKNEGNCWIFDSLSNQGYGQIMLDGKNRRAHVVAYELLVCVVPEGMVLDHLCRNRACVNPAHLEVVTNKENILRGTGLTAKNKIKTHCNKGHEFTEANTYLWKGSHRQCRKCKYDYEKARQARNKMSCDSIDTTRRSK